MVYKGTSQSKVGNFREIQKIDNHNIKYVSNPPGGVPTTVSGSEGDKTAEASAIVDKEKTTDNDLLVAIVVLLVITLLTACTAMGLICKSMQSKAGLNTGPNVSQVSAVELKGNHDT